jgi:hypothetical protein
MPTTHSPQFPYSSPPFNLSRILHVRGDPIDFSLCEALSGG